MGQLPNIAIVGATGLVGRTMAQVLEERNFEYNQIKLLASARSAGSVISINKTEHQVEELSENSFEGIDIALFSAGGEISRKYAPIAAKAGAIVIDNSSAWRMDVDVPLVVPEVNSRDLAAHKGIIANPNCSTIQLVVVLDAIDKAYGLKRVVCSTYQSISGAGQKGVDKLTNELFDQEDKSPSGDKHRIAFNTMFHPVSDFEGFTEEEKKMLFETRKILNNDDLKLAFTCVRLPIIGGHGESVNLELEKEFSVKDIKSLLSDSEGIILLDDINNDEYPTPDIAKDTDPVYVGRVRRDSSVENGLYLWIVADNLRKGAATNAVQIAEKLVEMDLV